MSDLDLPDSFWTVPETALPGDAMRQLYSTLCTEMLGEMEHVPGFGVLEAMTVERVCFLYVLIRHKETHNLFAHDRSYKETLQLWTQMAADVRKMKAASADLEAVRDAVLGTVNETIQKVLGSMHPDVADGLRAKFSDAFLAADL